MYALHPFLPLDWHILTTNISVKKPHSVFVPGYGSRVTATDAFLTDNSGALWYTGRFVSHTIVSLIVRFGNFMKSVDKSSAKYHKVML